MNDYDPIKNTGLRKMIDSLSFYDKFDFGGIQKFQNQLKILSGDVNAFTKALSDFQKPLVNELKSLRGINSAFFYSDTLKSNFDSIDKVALKGFENFDYITRIERLTQSQLSIHESFASLNKSLKVNLSEFKSVASILQGYTSSIIKESSINHNWESLDLVETINSTIAEETDSFIENHDNIDANDLQNLKESIIEELKPIIKSGKSENINKIIFLILAIIGLYADYLGITDKTNKTISKEIKQEIDSKSESVKTSFDKKNEITKQEIISHNDKKIDELFQSRIANNNVVLRKLPKKKSLRIGLIKKGQRVRLIETYHKWIFISYIDSKTNQKMVGFAYKKCFSKKSN